MGRVEIPLRRVTLPCGLEVFFRPIEADDGPLLVELFYTLSPESIYNRFLSPVREVTEEHVRRFVEIDQWSEVAIAACLQREGGEAGPKDHRIIGVGRYHLCGSDPEVAEVALLVGDPWQGKGVGGELLCLLAEVARCQGVRRFVSTVDPGNLRLMRFVEFYGFRCTKRFDNGLIRIEADI